DRARIAEPAAARGGRRLRVPFGSSGGRRYDSLFGGEARDPAIAAGRPNGTVFGTIQRVIPISRDAPPGAAAILAGIAAGRADGDEPLAVQVTHRRLENREGIGEPPAFTAVVREDDVVRTLAFVRVVPADRHAGPLVQEVEPEDATGATAPEHRRLRDLPGRTAVARPGDARAAGSNGLRPCTVTGDRDVASAGGESTGLALGERRQALGRHPLPGTSAVTGGEQVHLSPARVAAQDPLPRVPEGEAVVKGFRPGRRRDARPGAAAVVSPEDGRCRTFPGTHDQHVLGREHFHVTEVEGAGIGYPQRLPGRTAVL